MSDQDRRRFERLAAHFREAIQKGEIPVGTLLPSERQLQQTFGVSRTTVRRALADLVESGWAESSPNRGVVSRLGKPTLRSTRVAYVDHRDHVHKALFFKLHTRMIDQGLELVYLDSQDIGTMGALEKAADEGFAAAFVWPKVSHVDPAQLSAVQSRIPVIAVDHSIGGEPSDIVMSDHKLGARQAVEHLVRLGRRRIAISGNFTNLEDAQLRFAGYMVGLYEQGISPIACNFVFSSPQVDAYENPRLLQYRLTQDDRPDAVFVLHDISVPAIAAAVLECGLSVPNDVAVVGFGNDLPFNVEDAGLTTIGMNWEGVADALTSRLKDRLVNPESPFRRILVPTHLIVRGSCGAPREDWSQEPYEVSSATVTRRMRPSQPPVLASEETDPTSRR